MANRSRRPFLSTGGALFGGNEHHDGRVIGRTFEQMRDIPDLVPTSSCGPAARVRADPVCLRWSDGQPHGGMSPGFALAGTEVIFPLSTNIALRGTFEGEENVVKSDMATVAQLNSLIISNAENQVYAHDHTFKFKRRMPDELGSGATLLQDKDFIAAGERR